MIKLFACDLDGTLLNHLHCSDKWSEKAVKEILAQQKHFAIATGRHLHSNHKKGIGFIHEPVYKVCMNGALVLSPNDNVLYEKSIDSTFIKLLNEQFPDVPFEYVTRETVYITRSKWQHFLTLNKGKLTLKYRLKHFLGLIMGHVEQTLTIQDDILKIDCYIGHVKRAEEFEMFLKQHTNKIHNAGPNIHHFELTATHVNKQAGLMHVLKDLNLAEDEIAVYGNDWNDLDMLSYFKHSYAPSNAIEPVKQVVKDILASNRQNGVAKHILETLRKEQTFH